MTEKEWIEKERARFEAVFIAHKQNSDYSFERHDDGDYIEHDVEMMFYGWLAAKRDAVVPEGWKVVPIEPTDEQITEMCSTQCTECHGDCRCGPYKDIYQAGVKAAPPPGGDDAQNCD